MWLPGISISISVTESSADSDHRDLLLLAQQDLEGKRLAQTAAAGNLKTATSAQNQVGHILG